MNREEDQRARFRCRSQIIRDPDISKGSLQLFVYLDDEAKGAVVVPSIKQTKLAFRLRCSKREIQRRLSQLARAGYISIRRTQIGNEYSFIRQKCTIRDDKRVTSEATRMSPPRRQGCRVLLNKQEIQQEPLTPSIEQTAKPKPDCPRCYGLGYFLVERVFRGSGYAERQECHCIAQTARAS